MRVIARLLLGSHQPPATQQKGYESWRVVAGGYHHQNTDSSPGNIMGEGQWDIGRGQEEEGQSCGSQQARGQGKCEVVVREGQTPGTGRAWRSVKAGDISPVDTR